MEKNIRVLLTGATGFVGSYVAKALLSAGYKVSATYRQKSNLWRLEGLTDVIEWINVDKLESIDGIFDDTSISAVIHLATDFGRNGDYNEFDLVYNNIIFPIKLITAASRKGVKLFINTDTFYNTKDLKYSNLKGYALSKKQFLEWLNIFVELHGLRVVNMKLFHVYGPLDSNEKFVPSIIRMCLNGGPVPLTQGQQVRDFIYIDDVVDAFLVVLAKELEKKSEGFISLDVGTGRMCSIRRFVETANSLLGGNAFLDFGALPYLDGEDSFDLSNVEGIEKYGWRCRTTIEAGIKSVIDYLRNKAEVNVK